MSADRCRPTVGGRYTKRMIAQQHNTSSLISHLRPISESPRTSAEQSDEARSRDSYDVLIIGAGAAGLMCASVAGQLGVRVLLVDHAQKIGEKIRISGGGRCNFTNRTVSAENFVSKNPHFSKSALSKYVRVILLS
jgi:NADPH-dependent 2,4-dienoyl-CoA reductase/sulfur reductase-like enzyme